MRFLLIALLLLPMGAYGQEPEPVPVVNEPSVTVPETVTVKAGRTFKITAETDCKLVRWILVGLPTGDFDLIPQDEGQKSVIFCYPDAGECLLFAYAAQGDIPTLPAICKLVIEGKGPRPPPGPNPPGPTPDVDPTPVPNPANFRVLFVYESSQNHTREQLNILNSTAITTYLNERCVKGSDGRPEWRRFDPDVVVSPKETETIRKLWEATKPALGDLPQIVIVVNGKGEVFDLPDTEAETLALLKKYAEGK